MSTIFSSRLNTDILLRGIAIVLVVNNHAYSVYYELANILHGGMTVLLMLSGYMFARFVLQSSVVRDIHKSLFKLAAGIFWPCFILLMISFAVRSQFVLYEFLFISHWFSNNEVAYYPSWYIQTILQIFLLLAGLFAIKPFASVFLKWPFQSSVAIVAVGLGLHHLLTPPVWPYDDSLQILPLIHIWNFALGWALYYIPVGAEQSKLPRRLIVLGLTIVGALVALPPQPSFAPFALVIAMMLMLWVPSVTLPKPATQLLAICSQASFTIFLLHYPFQGLYRALIGIESGLLSLLFSLFGCLSVWILATAGRRAYNRTQNAASRVRAPRGSASTPRYGVAGSVPSTST